MTGGWIQTYSGLKFDVMKPDPQAICIIDIAHALSNICRYTGHCREFYSVAQHSVIISELVEDAMWGLMHDAAEAYLQDVARPVKQYLFTYVQMENKVMKVIADKFHLQLPIPQEVLEMDDRVLMTEARLLMRGNIDDWYTVAAPVDVDILPLSPVAAEKLFLHRYFKILDESDSSLP